MNGLIPISKAQARVLGEGNVAGFQDYVALRPQRWNESDTHLDPLFIRGYLAGYRLASRGKRPFTMKVGAL